MTIGVYEFYNSVTKKSYIGSSFNIEKRKKKHLQQLRQNKHFNKHFQNSFNKYGENIFIFKIIYVANSNILDAELRNIENIFIKDKGFDNCYNECPVAGSTKGKPHSLETKSKISLSTKGRKVSVEEKKRLGQINLGRKHTIIAKKNMSLSKRGKSVENRKKEIFQIDIKTNQIINKFSCGKEASLKTNIDKSSISRVCNGKAKQAGGYIWKFKENLHE